MSTATLDTTTVRRWKRYSEYRMSGLDWCAQVPAHWRVIPLKRVGAFASGENITADSITPEGDYPVYGGNGLRGYTTAYTHSGHYVLVGRQGALCGNINYADDQFWASEHAVVVTPRQPVEVTWLGETLRTMNLGQHSISTAQPGLSVERVIRHPMPVPPLAEQRAIAVFLSRETARIDALIGHKQRLIALLEEKRQAVISHAVTRGLDPSATLKDSGIPWLGVVPMHWTVRRLKFLLATPIEQGWSPVCDNRAASDEEWAVLKVGCVNGQEFDPTEHKALPEETPPEARYVVRPNDILMSRGNTRELVGNAALVRDVRPRLLLSDLLYRFQVDGRKALSEFVVRSLRSSLIRYQIELVADGSSPSMKKIGQQDIRELVILLPPMNEQVAIVHRVRSMSEHIDRVISRARDSVARLQEYRTALISAAVTGQIDVRDEVTS